MAKRTSKLMRELEKLAAALREQGAVGHNHQDVVFKAGCPRCEADKLRTEKGGK